MLPRVQLTLHSRMSGSRWVITPSRLSGSWRSFLYSCSVYSCYLLLISSASVRSILFLSFIVPVIAWNFPLVSLIFLKRSLICPILLFSSISFHWSLRKGFLCLLAILWNCAFRWMYLSFSPSPLFYFFSQQFVNKSIEQPCGEDDTVFILHFEIWFNGVWLIAHNHTMSSTHKPRSTWLWISFLFILLLMVGLDRDWG